MQTKQERLELIRQVHARIVAQRDADLEARAEDEHQDLEQDQEDALEFAEFKFNSDYFSIDMMEI